MPVPKHLTDEQITKLLKGESIPDTKILTTDVFIAGSGPIGAAYARTIFEQYPCANIVMCDIGSQDNPILGGHFKNSVKYQKDIDAFVNVIKGALQTLSVPPADTHISTLVGEAWRPSAGQQLLFHGSNPLQKPEGNLKASAVTRTVGGMATHWTCACPKPHQEERARNPIPNEDFDKLLQRATDLLQVKNDQYESPISMRHWAVKSTLMSKLSVDGQRDVKSLPLAVTRRTDNANFVTWSGTDTVLGNDLVKSPKFTLMTQTRVTKLVGDGFPNALKGSAKAALVRDLESDQDNLVFAKVFVIACGAVGTAQVLFNCHVSPTLKALGKYLSEQSLAFCQIVLKPQIVQDIENNCDFEARIKAHKTEYPKDPLPIPFADPEPQVMIPYTSDFPWHCQIHRDAFSYGDVGPRADSRVVVDLRFFGYQEIQEKNCVLFAPPPGYSDWQPGVYDTYGMPQPTFFVERSVDDSGRDQRMMQDMTDVANKLGAFLPGSQPQFMEPGLALHITGITRIGTDSQTSVANPSSKVHGLDNVWVGGNCCIPDATACNPTLTSVAIALKGAESIVEYLKEGTS